MTDQSVLQAAQMAPIVQQVHSAAHPELTRVREITDELTRTEDPGRIATLFQELRTVTHDYALPDDACEAFEATYKALQRADRRQQAGS